jgi:hypothetical protein
LPEVVIQGGRLLVEIKFTVQVDCRHHYEPMWHIICGVFHFELKVIRLENELSDTKIFVDSKKFGVQFSCLQSRTATPYRALTQKWVYRGAGTPISFDSP